MKMNRIQFQPGMSLNQFLASYGDEAQCEAVLEKSRWPQGFQSMYFLSQTKNKVSILELRRLTGLSYPAAWRMKHNLMLVMYERETTTRLSGRVKVDDDYLGGENPGGKAGRGSENKVPFIAAVQTDSKNHPLYVVFAKAKGFSYAEVKAWATRSLVPATTVVSDGLWCFQSITQAGCIQQREVVGKGRKSTDWEGFSWVNTILGNLKRHQRNLPCVRLPEVRSPLPWRVPVSFQSPLRSCCPAASHDHRSGRQGQAPGALAPISGRSVLIRLTFMPKAISAAITRREKPETGPTPKFPTQSVDSESPARPAYSKNNRPLRNPVIFTRLFS